MESATSDTSWAPSDAVAAFTETAREFVRREVKPHIDRWRHESAVPREFFSAAGDAGLLGLAVPEDHGGLELYDPRYQQIATHALIEANAYGLAWSMGLHAAVAAPVLATYLARELRDDLLPKIAAGEALIAVGGLSGEVTTTDANTLTGTVAGIPNAAIADWFLLTVTGADGGRRAALLRRDEVKVALSERPTLGAGEVGAAAVTVDGASSQALDRLGAGAGDAVTVAVGHMVSGLCLTAAGHCLTLTSGYVTQREVFGRPVAMFENTRAVVGDVYADVLSVSALYHQVMDFDGARPLVDAPVSAVALRAAAAFTRCADIGLQLHGGYGYMVEYPISHAFAAARYFTLVVGAIDAFGEVLARQAGLGPELIRRSRT